MKHWFVYILTNYSNNVFYTGVTNSWERRIWEHKQGFAINSFCTRYRLYKVVFFQEFLNPTEAIEAEKKLALIKQLNPNFQDLFTLR